MLIVIGIMFSGILVGYLLRSQRMGWISKIITLLIWILLFFLGTEVGNNKNVINGLYNLGFEAAILSVAGIIGSLIFAKLLWMWIAKKDSQKDK